MSPDDARATRIGRATASLAVIVVGCSALLVLLAAAGRKWATTGLWGCLLTGGVAWSIAYAEMIRHQRRTALPRADCDAWQERMFPVRARSLAFLGGIFVPWFYLLGSTAQRRLSVYERRPRRSRRAR